MNSRLLIILILISLSSNLVVAKKVKIIKSNYEIQQITSKFNRSKVLQQIQEFIFKSHPSRFVGTRGHLKSREYIYSQLKTLTQKTDNESIIKQEFTPNISKSIKMYKDDFQREIVKKFNPKDSKYKKWDLITKKTISLIKSKKNIKGQNIIWRKEGYINQKKELIIGAHYDNISHNLITWLPEPTADTPGADNNATGVVLALNLIKVLSDIDLPFNISVVFFDFAELGFLGSDYYVNNLKIKKSNIVAFLNLEMLGHDTKDIDMEKKLRNMRIYISKNTNPINSKESKIAKKLRKLGRNITSAVNFKIIDNGFNASDHISFREKNIPSLTFTQSWDTDFNPLYHSSKDVPETLNSQTYLLSTKYIIGATLAFLFDINS